MGMMDSARALARSAARSAVVRAADALGGVRDSLLSHVAAAPTAVPVLCDWDAEDIRDALLQHERGHFRQAALLADHMGRNDRIQSVLGTRMTAALGLPFRVDSNPAAPELGDLLKARWPKMMSRGCAAGIIRDCVMLGFRVCQRIWKRDPWTGEWSVRLKPWHGAFVRWDETLQVYIVTTREGEEHCPPDNSNPRWCVFVGLDEERPWMTAAVRSLAFPFIIVNWADRDWSRWSEKHGMPPLGAKVPEDKRNSLATLDWLDQLQTLASEPTILLPQGKTGEASYDLEWKELKNWQSYQGFLALAERQEKRIAIRLLGQNLTTEVTGGSYAAIKGHELVRQDYLEADALLINGGGRELLAVPWTIVNHEADARVAEQLAPSPCWDATPPANAELRGKAMIALGDGLRKLQDAGVDVDPEAEAKTAGIVLRTPEPGAEKKAKGQVFAWHVDRGVVTPDEARAITLGLGPLPEGQGAKPHVAPPTGAPGAGADGAATP